MTRILSDTYTNTVNLSVPGEVGLDDFKEPDLVYTDVANQSISGGAVIVPHNLGTIGSGTLIANSGLGALQFLTNNGAFSIQAPINPGSLVIEVTNGPSAGAITFIGFNVSLNIGENYLLTSGYVYFLSIIKINRATYLWKATQ